MKKSVANEYRRKAMEMYNKAPVDINKIPELINKYRGDLKFVPDAVPYFIYIPRDKINDNDSYFACISQVINDIKSLQINERI